METCAKCRWFVPVDGAKSTLMTGPRKGEQVQTGDCRRYPPSHVLNILTASEKEKESEGELVETPRTAKQYASPFYWLVVPEYATAFQGTNEALWCGEFKEKRNADPRDNGGSAPGSQR